MEAKYFQGTGDQIAKDLQAFIATITTVHHLSSAAKGVILLYTP